MFVTDVEDDDDEIVPSANFRIRERRFDPYLRVTATPSTQLTVDAGLRYEITRAFAPYVGVEWSRALGDTAGYIEARGGEAEDIRFIVGLKAWF